MQDYTLSTDRNVINCPAAIHLDYLQYMIHFCTTNKINLLLKGSVAAGTATKFSDIDIIVLEDKMDMIEQMVSGYKKIIMSNMTERPKGILILIYEDGLCIDLDVRKSVTQEELTNSVVLNSENIDNYVRADLVRNEEVKIPSVPEREDWYKLLRLFHRSLIKKGCQKEKEAESILQEIRVETEMEDSVLWSGNYLDDMQLALEIMEKKYVIPVEIKALIQNLMKAV